MLAEHLSRALHYATVNLPFHQRGIDHVTEIVHGGVTRDGRDPVSGVDLDFGDVAAVGIRCAEEPLADAVQWMRLRSTELGASSTKPSERSPA